MANIAPGSVGGFEVRGLRGLQRAFSLADKDAKRFIRAALADIAEPVKLEAQRLAVTEISSLARQNLQGTGQWAFMRVRVTQSLIYVAPQQRGRFTKRNKARYARPNMGTLLMEKAMEPALAKNAHLIEARIEHALDLMADHFDE